MRLRGPVAPIAKTHPLTGEPIKPVGFINGMAIWPICGGAPDDDDADDDNTDDGGQDDTSDDTDSGGDDKGDVISRAEYEELKKRMVAADKRAAALEQEKKKAEDAKKDELTKATDRVGELEQENATLLKQVSGLNLQVAFLSANNHDWHDPEEALASAERNGYLDDAIGEDGSVDKVRLGKALDRLAKEKKFLVRDKKNKDQQDDGPSGSPAGGRSDNGRDERARKAKLQSRFPVLNR